MIQDYSQKITTGPSNNIDNPANIDTLDSLKMDAPKSKPIVIPKSIGITLPSVYNPADVNKNNLLANDKGETVSIEGALGFKPLSNVTVGDKAPLSFESQKSFNQANYKASDTWKDFGYIIGRDNLAVYEEHQGGGEILGNAMKNLWDGLVVSHNDSWKSYGRDFKAISTGNMDALFDLGYDPNQLANKNNWENPIFNSPNYGSESSAKWIPGVAGSASFYGGLAGSMGFTLGTLAQTMEESLAIYGATLLTGGATGGGAVITAARTAKNLSLIRKVWEITKDVYKAGSIINSVREISKGANVLKYAQATLNLGRNIRAATGEASVTVAMNHAENLAKFKREFEESHGYLPEEKDLIKFNTAASDANAMDYGWQSALLFGTNLINEAALFSSFKSAKALEAAAIKKAAANITFVNGVAKTSAEMLAELPWLKRVGIKSGKYIIAKGTDNLSEGVQELGQAWLDGAASRYIDNQLKGLKNESYLSSVMKEIVTSDQQDADEFFGGFIMGTPISLVGKAFSNIQGKVSKKEVKSNEQQFADYLNKNRTGFTEKLVENALDFNRAHLNNQSNILNSIYSSIQNQDELSHNVFKNQAVQEYIYSGLRTGMLAGRLEELKNISTLSDEDIRGNFGLDEKADISQVKSYVNEIISKAGKIEENFNKIDKQLENPYTIKEGDQESLFKHVSFEMAKKDLMFNLHNQEFAVEESDKLIDALNKEHGITRDNINTAFDDNSRLEKIKTLKERLKLSVESSEITELFKDFTPIIAGQQDAIDLNTSKELKLLEAYHKNRTTENFINYINHVNGSNINKININSLSNTFSKIGSYNDMYRFSQSAFETLLEPEKFNIAVHQYELANQKYAHEIQKKFNDIQNDITHSRDVEDFLSDEEFKDGDFELNATKRVGKKEIHNDFVDDLKDYIEKKHGVKVEIKDSEGNYSFDITGTEDFSSSERGRLRGLLVRAFEMSNRELVHIKQGVNEFGFQIAPEDVKMAYANINSKEDLKDFASLIAGNEMLETLFKDQIEELSKYFNEKIEAVKEKSIELKNKELREKIISEYAKYSSTNKNFNGDYYFKIEGNKLKVYKDVGDKVLPLNLDKEAGLKHLLGVLSNEKADQLKIDLFGKGLASKLFLASKLQEVDFAESYYDFLSNQLSTLLGIKVGNNQIVKPVDLSVYNMESLGDFKLDEDALGESLNTIYETVENEIIKTGSIKNLKDIKTLDDLLSNDDLVDSLMTLGLFKEVLDAFKKEDARIEEKVVTPGSGINQASLDLKKQTRQEDLKKGQLFLMNDGTYGGSRLVSLEAYSAIQIQENNLDSDITKWDYNTFNDTGIFVNLSLGVAYIVPNNSYNGKKGEVVKVFINKTTKRFDLSNPRIINTPNIELVAKAANIDSKELYNEVLNAITKYDAELNELENNKTKQNESGTSDQSSPSGQGVSEDNQGKVDTKFTAQQSNTMEFSKKASAATSLGELNSILKAYPKEAQIYTGFVERLKKIIIKKNKEERKERRDYRKYVKESLLKFEPANLNDEVLVSIAGAPDSKRFKINSDSLVKAFTRVETRIGRRPFPKEFLGFKRYLSKTGGTSFSDFAGGVWHELGARDTEDDMDVYNEILDLMVTHGSFSAMQRELEERAVLQREQKENAEEIFLEEMREQHLKDIAAEKAANEFIDSDVLENLLTKNSLEDLNSSQLHTIIENVLNVEFPEDLLQLLSFNTSSIEALNNFLNFTPNTLIEVLNTESIPHYYNLINNIKNAAEQFREGKDIDSVNKVTPSNKIINKINLSNLTIQDLNDVRTDINKYLSKKLITNEEFANLNDLIDNKIQDILLEETKKPVKVDTISPFVTPKDFTGVETVETAVGKSADTFVKSENNFNEERLYLYGTPEQKAAAKPNLIQLRNLKVFEFISHDQQGNKDKYAITFSQPDISWPLATRNASLGTPQGNTFEAAYEAGKLARQSFGGYAVNTNEEYQDKQRFLEGHITDKDGNMLYFNREGELLNPGDVGYGDVMNIVTTNLPSQKNMNERFVNGDIRSFNGRRERMINNYLAEGLTEEAAIAKFEETYNSQTAEIVSLAGSHKAKPMMYNISFSNVGHVVITPNDPKPTSYGLTNPKQIKFYAEDKNTGKEKKKNLPFFNYGQYRIFIQPKSFSESEALNYFESLFSGDIPKYVLSYMGDNKQTGAASLELSKLLNKYLFNEKIDKTNINKKIIIETLEGTKLEVYTDQEYLYNDGVKTAYITTKGGKNKFGQYVFNDKEGNVYNVSDFNFFPTHTNSELALKDSTNLERPMFSFYLDNKNDELKFIVQFYNPEDNSIKYIDNIEDFKSVVNKTYTYGGKDFNINLNFDKTSTDEETTDMFKIVNGKLEVVKGDYKQYVYDNGTINISLDNKFKSTTPYFSLKKGSPVIQNYTDTAFVNVLSSKFSQGVKFFSDEKNIEKDLEMLENSGNFVSNEEYQKFKAFVLREHKLSKSNTIEDYLIYKDCL